nr:PAS domain-containing protein [Spirosoma pollinicola]
MATPAATAVFTGRHMLIQQVNAPMLAIWGKDASVMGKTLHAAMPELAEQPFLAQLQHVFDTGQPVQHWESVAQMIQNGQPRRVWFNHAYNPLYDQAGRIYGVINTAIDVSPQVLARQQLAESEAQFRALIKEAPVPTCLFVGHELRIEVANQAMITVWGKGPGVIGLPLAEALPELKNQHFLTTLDELLRTGETYSSKAGQADLVIDGKLQSFYFDYDFKPLYDQQGTRYAILETAVDVTQQVLDRRALEESEAALQNAIALAELGTWTLDIASGGTQLSSRHADMLGLTTPYLPYETVLAIVHPDDRERVRAAIERAQQSGSNGHFQSEYRIINARSGKQQLIRARGQTSFDDQGQPVHIAGTAQDVTLERESQKLLEQLVQERTEELAATNEELLATNENFMGANQALERANSDLIRSNQNLEQFAYIASHDLQEPLRKIQQFGDLLKTRLTGSVSGEDLTYLERMQIAASRMSVLIKDLLAFSRISTTQAVAQPVKLDEVVNGVLESLSVAIEESGAQIEVDDLPTVQGDPLQLSQLFQNLLANALKFRRTSSVGTFLIPQITVRARLLARGELPASTQPARDADQYHLIEVIDNGIGFEEKYLDRIFQVFQRLHGKNEFAGTGVGLAIVEKVVTNHGGAITASSKPNQGATFCVYLPA